ncbi:N-acetyl-gamma-glutamyl-phosphate reductase [Alkalilimnicola sp. S0819]|uniref:N-acetyl-gamma-glutamyl-phosphate reductase n=1 Tax=Alkalilimnicola sp. S0819 TaxID=2613922 RepID=UPI00126285C5|nr:N-acetyl-gamma-glutamyl-phosphate reductase [Alkalilimnicola sp. S0819]KAB7623041.1 N-acetyl-gamma-glutamyl-phosphate reductase [Alkalilimnicola sp. S0819]MPQ17154.1 N-acetyl-gamma-glutamyl-phosphate reductase [Alkalilimnicola sp. S0819]
MIKAGIVGGTGYTGVELLRLLARHPEVEVSVITSRGEAGTPVADMFPSLRGFVDLDFSAPDPSRLAECDVVFFATPHGVAMKAVPELLEAGVRVVDLGADFRLRDVPAWERWYGMEHTARDWVERAVYGLPELNRAEIREARLVANPGCYPTAVVLGWLPLLEAGLVDERQLVASCISGVSGAGRQARVGTLLCEANETFKAYGAGGHRHHPEIVQGLGQVLGGSVGLVFQPHLAPMTRGMHCSLYAPRKGEAVDLQALFERRYADEPFVDVMPAGSHPETRSVRGTNLCRLAVHQAPDSDTVTVFSVIDNLSKGAASQAVQNMNLMLGLDEKAGLGDIAVLP